MKRIIIGLLCAFLPVLTACGLKGPELPPYGQGDREEFDRFLEEICPREEPWTEEEIQTFESYVQPKGYEHVFSEEEIKELMKCNGVPETVTVQQAAEDVTLAFELLSYAYGGYYYFGGDEVLLPIRDSILAELESMREIETKELWKLLWEPLSEIIVDEHFDIFTDPSHSYKNEREYSRYTYFVRDLYFDDPAGADSRYVKRTIGPDGALTYCLAAVCRDPAELPKTMTVEGTEHDLVWDVALSTKLSSAKKKKVFEETTVAGGRLPVLRYYTFGGSEEKTDKFVATGTAYKEKPVFVLDLKGNLGGMDTSAYYWIQNFCGELNVAKRIWATKLSTYHTAAYGGFVSSEGNGWRSGKDDGTVWETDNLVFVLVDKSTSSAGEVFANMLTMGKRVVLVGINTCGCLNFGNISQLYLPNSGIGLYFGTNCCFYQSLEQADGIGYSPDLWVEPADSLDAVVRLCNYYGLYGEKQE